MPANDTFGLRAMVERIGIGCPTRSGYIGGAFSFLPFTFSPSLDFGFIRSHRGQVVKLVEQRTENPCVGGSFSSLSTSLPRLAYFIAYRKSIIIAAAKVFPRHAIAYIQEILISNYHGPGHDLNSIRPNTMNSPSCANDNVHIILPWD